MIAGTGRLSGGSDGKAAFGALFAAAAAVPAETWAEAEGRGYLSSDEVSGT